MALFPAYSSEDSQAKPASSSLSWLCNASCPPEVGRPNLQERVEPEDTEEPQVLEVPDDQSHSPQPINIKKRKKDKKKKKKKKKRKEERIESESPSSEDEEKFLRSRSNSRSRIGSAGRSPLRERSSTSRSASRSRLHSRSNSRSKSREKSPPSRKFRSRSPEARKSRSLSRSRSHRRSRSSRRRKSRSRSSSRRRRRRSKSRSDSRNKRSRSRRRQSRSRSKSRSNSRKKKSRSRSRSPRRKGWVKEAHTSINARAAKIVSCSKGVFLEELQGAVKPEEAFFLSLEGDSNNKVLATTHYTQLASYKTRSRGTLGCPVSIANHKKKVVRYYKKSALRVLYSDPIAVRRLITTSGTTTPHDSYVPLNLTHAEETQVKNCQASEINPLGIYDSKTENYLSGRGGLTPEDDIETCHDAEYAMWQSRARQYNERLAKEPSNITLWLEFVRFQDDSYKVLCRGGDAANNDDTASEKRRKASQKALAERKISILDSAIKKNIRSLQLYFERLEVGREVWDDKRLKQEWNTVVFNFPNKMTVWQRYLTHVRTHFTSFSLGSAVRAFGRCSERLRQMRDGVFVTHAPPSHIGRCLVDVATQLAQLWRQAGHMERAIALFQALLELNLFPPKHCNGKDVPLEAKLALLEPFWDSRAPRFGEEKALGWAKVMERREPVHFPEIILEGALDEEDELLARGGATPDLWLALEAWRERRHWSPWEQDPEDCEDPERMVSLEELSPHLFTLEAIEEKFYLVVEFLHFLGVPEVENCSCKGLTADNTSQSIDSRAQSSIVRPLLIETLHDTHLFGKHLSKEWGDAGHNILNIGCVGPSVSEPSCDDYNHFLCRAVQQAAAVFDGHHRNHLTLLHMKLLSTRYQVKAQTEDEARLKSLAKEIKKQIKSFLKSEEFRKCLPVYQEYGRVEEAMGRVSEAESVYVTALTIGTASGNALEPSSENFQAVINLYLSYIRLQIDREAEVRLGHHSNNILQSLCSFVCEGKFSPPNGSLPSGGNLLKAKKKNSFSCRSKMASC